jgi:hypothetical protein
MTVRELRKILFNMNEQDNEITIKDLEIIFQIEKAEKEKYNKE